MALAYLAEGYNAFVLRYSVGENCSAAMALEDAQAALAEVRSHAGQWHIAPDKIAAVGFSAGGHLAASLGTVEGEKPDALVLGYPATQREMGLLIGKEVWPASEKVTAETPPSFIFSTSDDSVVPVENSLCFASALAHSGVYFELHIYLTGEHGASLGTAATANGQPSMVNGPESQWFGESVRFLRQIWGDFALPGARPFTPIRLRKAYSLDTPLKKLLKNSRCREILEQYLPGMLDRMLSNPMAQGLSLNQIAAFGGQLMPPKLLEKLGKALDACN